MRTIFRILAITAMCAASTPLIAQNSSPADKPDSAAAGGQIIQTPAGPPPTPEHTGIAATLKDLVTDVKHLPSKQNLFWLAVGTGGAAAVHPADTHVTPYLVDASWTAKTFGVGAILGQSYTLLGSAATIYVVGRAKDDKRVSHVGSDLLQSVALAEGMSQVLKVTVRRDRPDGTSNSFPSGHAADTFAFATALERHLGWKGAVPAYAFASYVAASRLHDNRHYLSDVVFGAAIGIISGRTVTRHGREDFSATVTPVPGGAAVMFIRNPK